MVQLCPLRAMGVLGPPLSSPARLAAILAALSAAIAAIPAAATSRCRPRHGPRGSRRMNSWDTPATACVQYAAGPFRNMLEGKVACPQGPASLVGYRPRNSWSEYVLITLKPKTFHPGLQYKAASCRWIQTERPHASETMLLCIGQVANEYIECIHDLLHDPRSNMEHILSWTFVGINCMPRFFAYWFGVLRRTFLAPRSTTVCPVMR